MALCPICHSEIGNWIDDPILTPEGLAGEDYKGITEINWNHIKEIQNVRKSQEIEANISNKTTFSEISPTIPIHKNHILELRQSTEKLLENIESNLTHYFNYRTEEHEEVYLGTHKYGVKVTDKTNWTDLNLVDVKKIKAIHIEELRHLLPSILYNMESRLYALPSSISINRACDSLPKTTEIKVYWGDVDVTENATYEPTPFIEIVRDSGKVYIKANGAGSVEVSFRPPGFDSYVRDLCNEICSGEGEQEQCEVDCSMAYEENTSITINISSSYYLSYSGELQGPGLLTHWPGAIESQKLYGSGNPEQCSGPAFSWDDLTSLTYGINGYWNCDFLNRVDLTRQVYETCFTGGRLSFMPVYSFPYAEPCPNPNGITSGEFSEWMTAFNRNIETCFEGTEGYWFNFGWAKTVLGDWYYEAVDLDEDSIFDEWQLRVNRNEVITEGLHKAKWWASFQQFF